MGSRDSKDFVLTRHAKHMLRERRIAREWVERALNRPAWTEPDKGSRTLRHALCGIEERGDLILRVVYDPSVNPRRVITAFFDRGARRR